jgi:hypothetical protein
MRTRWIGMAATLAFVCAACGGVEQDAPIGAKIGEQEQATLQPEASCIQHAKEPTGQAADSPDGMWTHCGHTYSWVWIDCGGMSKATMLQKCTQYNGTPTSRCANNCPGCTDRVVENAYCLNGPNYPIQCDVECWDYLY